MGYVYLVRIEKIRNVAIVAHVDHGKTTLVDAMLRQSRIFRENEAVTERVMDSNDLERERGITIMAKNTAVHYQGTKINIVDTPGHADFGGEVERVMNMVDGVLLLVDATDGPMPQTKFVLKQALQRGHKVIVVLNKIDRPSARPAHALNATFDLFVDLGATEEQAEFVTVYTNAILGQASTDPLRLGTTLEPLFEAIVHNLPAPEGDPEGPLQLLVTNTLYDDYKGKIAVGRVTAGSARSGLPVVVFDTEGKGRPARLTSVFSFEGLDRVEVEEVFVGDIVALAGVADAGIGVTIADAADPRPLPPILVEEPTLRMTFAVNTSPLAGREGTHVTSRKLRERLFRELERDVALRVSETDSADAFTVSGRGELHLAILVENLRREGYEFQVSRPEVIMKQLDGKLHEPYEQLEVEVSQEALGAVVELAGTRRAELRDMQYRDDGSVHAVWIIPTRGLIGFRQPFLSGTRGAGVMNTLFANYRPFAGVMQSRALGSLVAVESGTATGLGLENAQERGVLFINPGTEVYEGMVVGQHIRERDLDVNVCRKKQLTNMRSSNSDMGTHLNGVRDLSLDDAIEYLADDELLEVTPLSYRIRKRGLTKQERERAAGSAKKRAVAS